ncbi:hypothetical protein RDABS01_002590 [Bienertia sinuspersici]
MVILVMEQTLLLLEPMHSTAQL